MAVPHWSMRYIVPRTALVLMGAAAGAATMAAALGRRDKALPQLGVWRRELATTRGIFEAARIAGLVQARYDELFASRPRFATRAVQYHLKRRILPVLALYQTLRVGAPSPQAALDETFALVRADAASGRRLYALLSKTPDPYGAFRVLAKPVIRVAYPEEGWNVEWVEDSNQRIAFNIRDRCPYRDTYTAFGAPELAPRHCTLDPWLIEPLSRWIRFEQSGTLAQGCDRCDFQYHRLSPGHNRAR